MKDQEKLKKLAEMAGIPVQGGRRCAGLGPIWNPLEDMNQALEVWRAGKSEFSFGETFCVGSFTGYGTFSATLEPHPCLNDWVTGPTEAEALCNALLEIGGAE